MYRLQPGYYNISALLHKLREVTITTPIITLITVHNAAYCIHTCTRDFSTKPLVVMPMCCTPRLLMLATIEVKSLRTSGSPPVNRTYCACTVCSSAWHSSAHCVQHTVLSSLKPRSQKNRVKG
jgi:hypothetical protein